MAGRNKENRWRATCGEFPSLEQPPRQLVPGDTKMLRDIAKNSGKGSEAQGRMARNCNVVLATLMRRQAQMASGLASDFVTEAPEGANEFVPAQVTRQSHAVMTSSRTK